MSRHATLLLLAVLTTELGRNFPHRSVSRQAAVCQQHSRQRPGVASLGISLPLLTVPPSALSAMHDRRPLIYGEALMQPISRRSISSPSYERALRLALPITSPVSFNSAAIARRGYIYGRSSPTENAAFSQYCPPVPSSRDLPRAHANVLTSTLTTSGVQYA